MTANEFPHSVQQLEIGNILLRARLPGGVGPHPVFLLLHGWTGDETSMWIFAARLPANALLVAPRGLYDSPLGGYSWYPRQEHTWPDVHDFTPAISALVGLLSSAEFSSHFPQGDISQLRLLGFSQGAALAYSFALCQALPLRALAALSGFTPDGAAKLADGRPLDSLPVFIAHGERDQLVPIARARQSVEILRQAGAVVSYCEHDAGHKLNAACFRSLQIFFQHN